MGIRSKRKYACGCFSPLFIFFIMTTPLSAFAVLGENVSSIKTVKETLNAKLVSPPSRAGEKLNQKKSEKTTQQPNWTVQAMEANGNIIKEYANSDGLVFAVTWKGIKKPDLELLFGSYYDEYERSEKIELEKNQQIQRQGHRKNRLKSMEIRTSKIKVQRSGHMRAIRGKAFVPSLLPQGFTEGDITP
ncbi:MAG: DUF2844 domain-containing protein [Pseudobdellovibrionaceae bacterium]